MKISDFFWHLNAFIFITMFMIALSILILMMFDSIPIINKYVDFILGDAFKYLIGMTAISGLGLLALEPPEKEVVR